MRVIVTEKGQDLRKELFFDKINHQSTVNLAEERSTVGGGIGSARKKTHRGQSVGSDKDPNYHSLLLNSGTPGYGGGSALQ